MIKKYDLKDYTIEKKLDYSEEEIKKLEFT